MTDFFEAETPTAETEAAPEPPRPPELPGRRLREAREARGLSVADVAQALKFGPRQIEALETDDLPALPGGTTFLRGFVRSYARFLKLDVDALLATLDVQAPMALPDVRPPQNIGSAMPVPTIRQIPLLIAASVVLLTAAAIVGAWHFVGKPVAAPAAKDAGRPAAAVSTPQPQAEAADADGQAVPDANSPDVRQLAFDVRESSWIEVRDAGQQVLLTGEFSAGSRQAARGRPPLQLVIGNASNVGLSMDGKPVDLAPHIRAEVARLTLE